MASIYDIVDWEAARVVFRRVGSRPFRQSLKYKVTGPYLYPGDSHTCFRISAAAGGDLVACVYANDGNEERAVVRARVMARAIEDMEIASQ